jgi:enoyl-CoA hydratase
MTSTSDDLGRGCLLVERQGRIAVLTLNRPTKKNAVDGEMTKAIEQAIDMVEDDPDIWIGVLAARGDVFCAGADMAVIAAGRASDMSTKRGGWAGFVARERTKPFIAAVDAPALAGGFELALACDLLVASERATFALPEVKRGLIAAAGGIFRLMRTLPRATALELILTGSPLSAEQALSWGLCNEVTEPGRALEHALVLAERICENAPLAVRAARRLALGAEHAADDTGWQNTSDAVASLVNTEDFKEGPRAFLERRRPIWTGR